MRHRVYARKGEKDEMEKKLTKAVLVSLGLLCIAAIVYLTLDVTSAIDDVYALEQSSNTRIIYTKQNFAAEWENLEYITRVQPSIEDPVKDKIDPPDTVIGGGGTQDENAKIVYDVLIALGYTHDEACGLLGNIAAESSFIASRVQGDKHVGGISCCTDCVQVGTGKAHGIIQWDGGRRDKLLQQDWTAQGGWFTLKAQLMFMTSELTSAYYSKFVGHDALSTNKPAELDMLTYATYMFYAYYEVPGSALNSEGKQKKYEEVKDSDKFTTRLTWAQYYSNLFRGE